MTLSSLALPGWQIQGVTPEAKVKAVAVIAAFALYVATIYVFATIYHTQYRAKPSAFLFASDVAAGRLQELLPMAERDVAEAAELKQVIDVFVAAPEKIRIQTGVAFA